jgi:hypothetical protein
MGVVAPTLTRRPHSQIGQPKGIVKIAVGEQFSVGCDPAAYANHNMLIFMGFLLIEKIEAHPGNPCSIRVSLPERHQTSMRHLVAFLSYCGYWVLLQFCHIPGLSVDEVSSFSIIRLWKTGFGAAWVWRLAVLLALPSVRVA